MPHSLSARPARPATRPRLAALLVAALLAGACGNRGPLFLPGEDPATATRAQAAGQDDEADATRRREPFDPPDET